MTVVMWAAKCGGCDLVLKDTYMQWFKPPANVVFIAPMLRCP